MAAFEQVVLILSSGVCSCRLFHVYGKTMSTADPHPARDISVSEMFRKMRKGRQISQPRVKEASLPEHPVVCVCGCVQLYIPTLSRRISPEKQSREADEELGRLCTVHTQVVLASHFWTLGGKTHIHVCVHTIRE